MFKSILRFIRFSLIGTLWTYVFIFCAHNLMLLLWNFNFLSARSWQIIIEFWNSGGVIKSTRDYMFLLMLLLLPVFWVLGWRYFHKVSYLNLLLYPINKYNSYVIKKYGQNTSRVVLKNIKSTEQMIEDIKNEIASIKPEKSKQVQNIRDQINKTISDEIK